MRWSWYLDLYQLEHRVVRARNYLNIRFQARDAPDKRKIFVVGHPRTGTLNFHRLFRSNGLKSQHTPGRWDCRAYDCFSDRGNFQPVHLLDTYYPNSFFILNTRPLHKYIRSVIHHRFGRGKKSSGWFEPSVTNIENEIIERNEVFLRFARRFHGRENFLVVNIEREGAYELVAEHLGLEPGEIRNTPRSGWREKDQGKIERALSRLGIEDRREEPFLLESLLKAKDRPLARDFRRGNSHRLWL